MIVLIIMTIDTNNLCFRQDLIRPTINIPIYLSIDVILRIQIFTFLSCVT